MMMTPHEPNSTAGHIALSGLPNTRDLGYLKTTSGQSIVTHKLIRSGTLTDASDNDLAILLDDYALRTVIDMRTEEEIEKSPDPQDKMPNVTFINDPIIGFSTTGITRENGLAGMVKSLAAMNIDTGTDDIDPTKLMMGLYPTMLLDETGIKGYAHFFEVLLGPHEGSVLWHCSAGKDRAGLGTVLLLQALGVAWHDIVSDYMATNLYLAGKADDLKKLIPEQYRTESLIKSLKVLNSADESFLDAAVAQVNKQYGSLDGYIKDALGVTDQMTSDLRKMYLR